MTDINILLITLWGLIGLSGGILIVQNLFSVNKDELLFLGIAAGIVLETFIANILAQIFQPPGAFWLSAFLILASGCILEFKFKQMRSIKLREVFLRTETFWYIALIILFTMIGLGLPIFDDFQNLPTVSRMAAGDIPPHFALNPEIRFGYHYFLLLISAQIVRIGGVTPALGLDLVRSLLMVTTIFLGGKFIYRWTGSRVTEMLGVVFLLFSTGCRWLFFLSPKNVKNLLDSQIHLIGSGEDSGRTLFEALLGPWMIEAGPIPFPFAYTSGINPPMVLALGGIGSSATMILMLLLLTYHSRRNWLGLIPVVIFFTSLALASEVWFFILGGGMLLLLAYLQIFKKKTLGKETILLVVSFALGGIISLMQGGMLTELARTIIFSGNNGGTSSYYDITLKFIFPPALVSGHLGILYFNNPVQLLAGFIEIGPILLVLPFIPLVIAHAVKNNDQVKATLGFSAIISSLMVFVLFQGSGGVSGTTRLLEPLLFTSTLLAVPLGYTFLAGKGTFLKSLGAISYSSAILSGVVIFAISLAAISRPVQGDFLRSEDMQVYKELWNKLPKEALVYDAIPARAVTIFGRATKSNFSWFEKDPAWEEIKLDPAPDKLSKAGFSYAYLDLQDWEALSAETQAQYKSNCSELLLKIQNGDRGRRLYKIENCK